MVPAHHVKTQQASSSCERALAPNLTSKQRLKKYFVDRIRTLSALLAVFA